VQAVDEAWGRARRIAERQGWLVTAADAKAVGLLRSQVSAAVESGAWAPLLRGVYLVDADMYADIPVETWWRAALLAHGPTACLVGCAAARAHGAAGLPAVDAEVDVALVGGGSRHRRAADPPGIPVDGPLVVVRQWPVAEAEVRVVDGLRVRSAELSVVDAALQLDRAHALCLFDGALHSGLHTPETLAAAVATAGRRPGVVHVRAALDVADGRAASPLESRVRLACIDGDLAPDDLQYVVRDDCGTLVAIGELAWWKNRLRPLIAEADGREVHSRPEAVLHDRRRTNALVVRSCDVVRFTWADSLRPVYIQQVVRSALRAG
jgi:hypothetical protein